MQYTNIPMKPFAPSPDEQERWNHTALRKRMIIGAWEQDLEDELSRHLPADRREAWGPADLSSNPFEQITRQLSVLYHEIPAVTNLNGDISELTSREGLVTKAGLWQLMQRAQQMVIGLRESAIRIDVNPHVEGAPTLAPGIQYRIVTPDMLYCEAHPDQPDIPVYYQEARLRDYEGKAVWVADVLDIRDPKMPVFGMYIIEKDGSLGMDVSEYYMGHPTHRGEDYPYRDGEGNPFLPVVLYHAEKTGFLWDSYNASQMVYGSLTSAVLYSMWVHLVRESISKYEMRVGLAAGLSPSELSRTNGDPRSGYALAVSKSGQREAQKKFAPIFRLGDEELLAKTAMLANRFLGTDLPEDGYRVSYHSMPLTPEEMRAQREDITAKMQAGLISPVQAVMMMYDDMDDREAREYLLQIRRERAEFL